MQKKNIYKIDDLLIKIGRFLLIIFVIRVIYHFSSDTLITYWQSLSIWFIATAALLGAGLFIRHRENQIIAIWNILEHSTEVPVTELMQNTGFTRDFIQSALVLINRRGHAYYVWDQQNDIILDGRLRNRFATETKCNSCGAIIKPTMTFLDTSQLPVCSYCGDTVSSQQINQLKMDTLQQIRATTTQEQNSSGKFKLWIFILLLIFFWPAAIAYAIWKADVLKLMYKK